MESQLYEEKTSHGGRQIGMIQCYEKQSHCPRSCHYDCGKFNSSRSHDPIILISFSTSERKSTLEGHVRSNDQREL